MEDGIFLGRVVSEVIRGTITLPTAIELYEKKRIPRAFHKAQSAFTQGELYSLRGTEMTERDQATFAEVKLWDRRPGRVMEMPPTYRTPQIFSSPWTVPSILNYDAECDADFAVDEWLMNQGDVDQKTFVSKGLRAKWWSAVHDNGVERWDQTKAKL